MSPSPAAAVVLRAESEAAFQSWVVDLAHLHGWRVAHFRGVETRGRWQTPVAADGAGWPDLVLVRDRVLFAELKSERGTVGPYQRRWIDVLRGAGAEVHVWRPSMRAEIGEVLR